MKISKNIKLSLYKTNMWYENYKSFTITPSFSVIYDSQCSPLLDLPGYKEISIHFEWLVWNVMLSLIIDLPAKTTIV